MVGPACFSPPTANFLSPSFMSTKKSNKNRRFNQKQMVSFAGGIGKIISYQPVSNTWTYAVQMDMGPEPPFGRIGFETTIILEETELQAVV